MWFINRNGGSISFHFFSFHSNIRRIQNEKQKRKQITWVNKRFYTDSCAKSQTINFFLFKATAGGVQFTHRNHNKHMYAIFLFFFFVASELVKQWWFHTLSHPLTWVECSDFLSYHIDLMFCGYGTPYFNQCTILCIRFGIYSLNICQKDKCWWSEIHILFSLSFSVSLFWPILCHTFNWAVARPLQPSSMF